MNSPSCTTPSKAPASFPRGAAAAVLAAALLCACGGSKPDPEQSTRAAEEASDSPDPAKGQGVVSFHYSNRSTDANLQVDLGATDISLEMTGKPAEAAKEAAAQQAKHAAPKGKQPAAEPDADADPKDEEAQAERKPGRKPQAKAPAKPKPDTEAAEEELNSADDPIPQDVTDKVLLGIRKAQEFFYQKRYPEALQMVRSSLDARPTAEGHALAGSIHYMMGATGLARRHWQQALRLNPDMPAVVNMLEKIATPGGRGSPHPRPLAARRNTAAPSPSVLEAAAPLTEPPFPDEFAEPVAPPRAPAQAAPAPAPAAAPAAPAPAPAAPKPAAAPASSAAPAPAGANEVAAAPVPAPIAPAAKAPASEPAHAAPAATEAADPEHDLGPADADEHAPAPAAKPAAPAPARHEAPAKPKFPQKASGKEGAAKPADAKKDKSP